MRLNLAILFTLFTLWGGQALQSSEAERAAQLAHNAPCKLHFLLRGKSLVTACPTAKGQAGMVALSKSISDLLVEEKMPSYLHPKKSLIYLQKKENAQKASDLTLSLDVLAPQRAKKKPKLKRYYPQSASWLLVYSYGYNLKKRNFAQKDQLAFIDPTLYRAFQGDQLIRLWLQKKMKNFDHPLIIATQTEGGKYQIQENIYACEKKSPYFLKIFLFTKESFAAANAPKKSMLKRASTAMGRSRMHLFPKKELQIKEKAPKRTSLRRSTTFSKLLNHRDSILHETNMKRKRKVAPMIMPLKKEASPLPEANVVEEANHFPTWRVLLMGGPLALGSGTLFVVLLTPSEKKKPKKGKTHKRKEKKGAPQFLEKRMPPKSQKEKTKKNKERVSA